ncbi:hypothetical protein L6164_007671 [Bauhinia variegata]|uniref:Uncharacterized protein n=1 Tax=Bauhinia variegata TaxID=167791 RepID=A0ACB9PEB6_BAUVA|nr:hypothetical protein L6164_007671 [Bauhinia variegata]
MKAILFTFLFVASILFFPSSTSARVLAAEEKVDLPKPSPLISVPCGPYTRYRRCLPNAKPSPPPPPKKCTIYVRNCL